MFTHKLKTSAVRFATCNKFCLHVNFRMAFVSSQLSFVQSLQATFRAVRALSLQQIKQQLVELQLEARVTWQPPKHQTSFICRFWVAFGLPSQQFSVMAQQLSSPMFQNASTTNSPATEEVSPLLALPTESLQAIVSRIPLQLLITTFALVHPKLSTYRKVALQTTSHLEIFIGKQTKIQGHLLLNPSSSRIPCSRFLVDPSTRKALYPETGDFYRLRLSTLESPTVDKLIRLMPGISHLTVCLSQVDILILPELIRLLISWAPTLKTLIFSCELTPLEWVFLSPFVQQRDITVYSYMIRRVITAINDHLMVLEYLTLDIFERLFEMSIDRIPVVKGPPFPMPILGRLKECYISTRDEVRDFFFDSLHAYIPAECPLEAVGIAFIWGHWNEYLDRIPAGCPLASRIVALPHLDAPWQGRQFAGLDTPEGQARLMQAVQDNNFAELFPVEGPQHVEENMQLHRTLLGAYPNLRVVDLILDKARPLSAYLGVLSSLKQLQALKLTINDSQALKFEALPDVPPVLPTVFVLHIRHRFYQHIDLACSLWAHIFPNVQIVMLQRIYSEQFCTICYPDADQEFVESIPEQYEAVMPCLKQLIAPLIVLPSLRKIFYQQDGKHDNTVEFSCTGDFVQTHTEDIY